MRGRRWVVVVAMVLAVGGIGLTGCDLRGVVTMSLGHKFACELGSDAVVRCWGNNAEQELNIGTTMPTHNPLEVPGATDAAQVAAGKWHVCARFHDGTLGCWGYDTSGQLGRNNTEGTDARTNITIPGLAGVTDVGAGDEHTCAVLGDGSVRCWGRDVEGELGDGAPTTSRTTPVSVVGLTNATQVALGTTHTCARLDDGTVSCWGHNHRGQLGDGTTSDHSTPVAVPGLTGVVAIDVGGHTTCALLGDGSVRCWGDNSAGQLGDGTLTSRSAPSPVPGLSDVQDISVGTTDTCAGLGDGTVRCWGDNTGGKLGDGSTTNRRSPTPVTGITDAASVDAGGTLTCVVRVATTAACFGENGQDQLTSRTVTSSAVPVPVDEAHVAGPFIDTNPNCGIRTNHTVQCWGDYQHDNIDHQLAVTIPGIDDAVSLSRWDTCALRSGGTIACWGPGAPTDMPGISGVTAFDGGRGAACLLRAEGTVACWGPNLGGETSPLDVGGLTGVTHIAVGEKHACAIKPPGQVWCWGDDSYRQLGGGIPVAGVDATLITAFSDAVDLTAGVWHSCAVRANTQVWCWGDNTLGELGNGVFVPDTEDVLTGPPGIVTGAAGSVSVNGFFETCVVKTTGEGLCWGNYRAVTTRPRAVLGLTGVDAIEVGRNHACARRDGLSWCWSRISNANLGTAGDWSRGALQPVITSR